MSSFACPHNANVHINGNCCITECPYHVETVEGLFSIDNKDTMCVIIDSDMMANVSDSRTQISALSRDKRRKVSPKNIRIIYDDALMYMKTLHKLTHDISHNANACNKCGYPTGKGDCLSLTICKNRSEWVTFVCSVYHIADNLPTRQLIWDLLLKDELHLEEAAKTNALECCSRKDMENLMVHRETLLANGK